MIVSRIELNCSRKETAPAENTGGLRLILFRSPVTFTINGAEEHFDDLTAVIFTESCKLSYRSRNGEPLKCDIVEFSLSSGEEQYVGDLNIRYDVPVRVKNGHMIADILKNMKQRSQVISKNNQEFMELALRMIFIWIGDPGKTKFDDRESALPQYAKLKKLREEIYDDPLGDWSVQTVCKRMKISPTYFHRIYQSAFNVPFRQDVIRSKLVLAADKLANTDESVGKIAVECGYENEPYFMRQFKQHNGVTPTEYRKLRQLEQEEEKEDKKAIKYFT